MKPVRRKGFTLVELMFVVAFLGVVTAFVADALVETSRIQNITGADYDMQRQGHHQMDTIVDDIHDSQLVLSTYTYNSTVYNSDEVKVLILQAPSYDSAGDALGTDDIIIYHLTGTAAPYNLNRIVVPAAGSARSSVKDVTIINNVLSLGLTYYVDDTVTGDGTTKTFTLSGQASAAPTITENATALTSSQFTFTSPQTVTFNSAPTAPEAVDMIYTVSPSVSPSQVGSIDVDLHLEQVSTAFGTAAETQSVELDSRTGMRNH